jgi:uroporphyrinogen III methyltransferase/synthase
MLADEGATVVEFPTVTISPPPDPEALDSAIGRIEAFHWVVFCHVSAARVFLERLIQLRGGLEPLAQTCRLAAVGSQRTAALVAYGLNVEVSPAKASLRETIGSLAKAAGELSGAEVLVVSGDPAGPFLEDLERRGASVTFLQSALRELSVEGAGEVARLLDEGRVSAVVFLSPSGVDQFQKALETEEGLTALSGLVPAYAMSSLSAERARKMGFGDVRFPEERKRQALMEALRRDFTA